MISLTLSAVLLQPAATLPAEPVPAVPSAPSLAARVSPPPVPAETELWALVRRVNSVPAYETYLRRFPAGPHRSDAVEAWHRLQGRPVVQVHAPAPPLPPVPALEATLRVMTPGPCYALMAARPVPDEARDYFALEHDGRPEALNRYLARYPGGACSPAVANMIERRAARRTALVPIPGLGPLPHHRLGRYGFHDFDYPTAALRAGEQGDVKAEWNVAADGAPESCRIAVSSGSASLDRATCSIVMRRMTYDPARDPAGNPVGSTDNATVRWVLPEN